MKRFDRFASAAVTGLLAAEPPLFQAERLAELAYSYALACEKARDEILDEHVGERL